MVRSIGVMMESSRYTEGNRRVKPPGIMGGEVKEGVRGGEAVVLLMGNEMGGAVRTRRRVTVVMKRETRRQWMQDV
jgi:hypothetical protein